MNKKIQHLLSAILAIFILFNIIKNPVFHNMNTEIKKSFKLHPTLSIDNHIIDFGEIRADSLYNHLIKVKNLGNHDLILYDVRPDCGCTSPHWEKNAIKKNEEGEILLALSTYNKKGDFQLSVTIVSNDITNENAMVYLKGFIK